MTKILYLHGFASSANSTKALQLEKYIEHHTKQTNILIPNIENNILKAVDQINFLMQTEKPTALIGSSLGGFYGTYFAEEYGVKFIGINPAVMPPAQMSEYLGENKNYSTGEKFIIDQDQLDLLDAMSAKIKSIKSNFNYMVLLQSSDQVLDYRAALGFYKGAYLDVSYGGSHSFENFEDYFEKIRSFLNMH
ncbi:MAG: YqiA/YcfP family alpha/beta fold hydrolase [Gammaproteobacteria bacterium]|jgi:predicted esterase YcpF (UPF0227 family)|tara:strand:+ start:578 stop:1153 length:576 start_codon:yes stop_codon:yes gene_type:complete